MKKTLLMASLFLFCISCSQNNSLDRKDSNSCSQDQCGTNDYDQDLDDQITARVKAALRNETSMSGSALYIGVETTDRVVTLTGKVPSDEEFHRIARKVSSVEGVRKVNNQLTISS